MSPRAPWLVLAAALGLAACVQIVPATPYRFRVEGETEALVDRVADAFEAEGLATEPVEPSDGLVRTTWLSTGQMYGDIAGHTATLHRRYVATVTEGPSPEVVLTVELERCAEGTMDLLGRSPGACEPVEGSTPEAQHDLEALGVRLGLAVRSSAR